MAAAPPRGGGGRVAERTTTDLASGVPPLRLTAPALVSAACSPATSTALLGFSPITLIAAGELPPRLRVPALHFGLHLRPSRPRPRLHGDCSDVPRPVVRQPPVGRLDCWAHSCVQPRVPEVDISHGLHVTAGGLHTPGGRRLTPCVELEAAYPGPVSHAASDGTSAPPAPQDGGSGGSGAGGATVRGPAPIRAGPHRAGLAPRLRPGGRGPSARGPLRQRRGGQPRVSAV